MFASPKKFHVESQKYADVNTLMVRSELRLSRIIRFSVKNPTDVPVNTYADRGSTVQVENTR